MLVLINASETEVEFTLPPAPGEGWRLQLDTAAPTRANGKINKAVIAVPARGLQVLISVPGVA